MTSLTLFSDVTASREASQAHKIIILGSSLGSSTQLWDLALPTLSAHYTVIRCDLPGHGQSPVSESSFSISDLADAVIAVADSHGVTEFDYAGVSVSGAIAQDLAYRYPERVTHSAVVCSAPYFGGPEGWVQRIALVKEAGTAGVVPSIPERWFAPDFPSKDPQTVAELLTQIAHTDDHSYIQVCEALAGFDARNYLAEVKIPVLVISGELDPGAPPAAGALIAQSIPQGRQVVISHTSHQAVVEKPLEVATELINFFDNA